MASDKDPFSHWNFWIWNAQCEGRWFRGVFQWWAIVCSMTINLSSHFLCAGCRPYTVWNVSKRVTFESLILRLIDHWTLPMNGRYPLQGFLSHSGWDPMCKKIARERRLYQSSRRMPRWPSLQRYAAMFSVSSFPTWCKSRSMSTGYQLCLEPRFRSCAPVRSRTPRLRPLPASATTSFCRSPCRLAPPHLAHCFFPKLSIGVCSAAIGSEVLECGSCYNVLGCGRGARHSAFEDRHWPQSTTKWTCQSILNEVTGYESFHTPRPGASLTQELNSAQ